MMRKKYFLTLIFLCCVQFTSAVPLSLKKIYKTVLMAAFATSQTVFAAEKSAHNNVQKCFNKDPEKCFILKECPAKLVYETSEVDPSSLQSLMYNLSIPSLDIYERAAGDRRAKVIENALRQRCQKFYDCLDELNFCIHNQEADRLLVNLKKFFYVASCGLALMGGCLFQKRLEVSQDVQRLYKGVLSQYSQAMQEGTMPVAVYEEHKKRYALLLRQNNKEMLIDSGLYSFMMMLNLGLQYPDVWLEFFFDWL